MNIYFEIAKSLEQLRKEFHIYQHVKISIAIPANNRIFQIIETFPNGQQMNIYGSTDPIDILYYLKDTIIVEEVLQNVKPRTPIL